MPKLSRHPFFILIIVVLIVILLTILHLVGILQPVENLLLRIVSPIEKGFSRLGTKIDNTFHFLGQIKNLSRQNKELEEKNKKLLAENTKLKEVEKENDILRQQFDYEKRAPNKLLPAFIVSFDPYNLLQSVVINRGAKDKVKAGMAVVAFEGILVGQVQEVDNNNSKVLLIIDGHSTIPALIQANRADGIVRGEHGLGLIMEMIPQDKIVQKNDVVITSALGSKLPQGLVVGEIEEILSTENELFQKARIKSPVDFKKLESVYVVLE